MNEFELYNRILAPRLRLANQRVLLEKQDKKTIQRAEILPSKNIAYSLFRYDQGEQKDLFFPFFNKTHNGEYGKAEIPTLENLLKFCDYILLAEKNGKLYVLLIEMKRSQTGEAQIQLDASAIFMKYIENTAQRISIANGYENFESSNIKIKKIILKSCPRTKPMTNKAKSKVNNKIDTDAPLITYSSNIFPLYTFCQ